MSIQVEAVGSSSAFGRLLGLEIHQVGNGEAVLGLSMHDGLRNLHGKLHGGALFSLIDTAMGQASHSPGDGSPASSGLCHQPLAESARLACGRSNAASCEAAFPSPYWGDCRVKESTS